MRNKYGIAILLATYNGERFLADQLDSLLQQSYQNFTVFVHDDCSKDGTLELLKRYARNHPGKFVIMDDNLSVGRGARDSFMFLLEHVESSYYMFCDQDDIWQPDKVERSITRMREEERNTPNIPIVVHSDLQLVDQDANPLGETSWGKQHLTSSWFDTLEANYIWVTRYSGCTMLFNEQAKNVSLPLDKRVDWHDLWIGLRTNMNHGRIVALDGCTILYRQHGDNTSGVLPKASGMTSGMKHLSHLKSYLKNHVELYRYSNSIFGCSPWRFLKAKMHYYRLKVR